jgi:ketosteroid isomerase-like protein
MSQENVELLHRALDAFNRRHIDAFLMLMDDEVEGVPRIAAIEGSYHGHEGMRRWWKNLLDAFPDFTVEVGEVRDLGDVTVAVVHLRGQGAGGDTPTEATIWYATRWRERKCLWWRTFDTQAAALEAVGLSEQDAHADS